MRRLGLGPASQGISHGDGGGRELCSRLLQVGGSIEVVRMLAGHADLSTTQRYVHAGGADSVAAITRISGK
jgi:hypothetical protein